MSDPIDTDPAVVAARDQARQRRALAARLDEMTSRIGRRAADDIGLAVVCESDPTRITELAGSLARLAREVEQARDLAVMLARTMPPERRPSWAQLAAAMGEPDRNNLARRYRPPRTKPWQQGSGSRGEDDQ